MFGVLKGLIRRLKKASGGDPAPEQPRDHRKGLGARGEAAAAKHLSKQGFKILETNYRCPLGEADLIARKGPLIVFAEVKTRQSEHFGAPHFAVTKKKQQRIIRIAKYYIKTHHLEELQCRFDVFSVRSSSGARPKVEHIPGAFTA